MRKSRLGRLRRQLKQRPILLPTEEAIHGCLEALFWPLPALDHPQHH